MTDTRVMLLGDIDIREQAREALDQVVSVEIVGELAGFGERQVRFVQEISPDVVVVDGAAFDIDAFSTISILRASGSVDRIVAVAPDCRASDMLIESGADVVVSTQEELRSAIVPAVVHLETVPEFDHAA